LKKRTTVPLRSICSSRISVTFREQTSFSTAR
jgi:hypothetical protein